MWKETRIGVIGSVDSGKCFAYNTPIIMSDKSIKKIQNIKIGDCVLGDDFKEAKLVRIVVRGKSTMFKIYQKNAMDYRVNRDHILSLKIRKSKYKEVFSYLKTIEHYPDKNDIIDINVNLYFNLPGNIKKNLLGVKHSENFSETSEIVVIRDGFDFYYGFSFYHGVTNRRFLLADKTVVHNSTLTGVVINDLLDDGRGKVRSLVMKHPHEKQSGRTSCIVQNYMRDKENKSVQILVDLAGHEKYLKTTISGISKCFIDYACIVVAANMGVLKMTREHLGIVLGMNIPFCIVLTKIDISPKNVTERTLNDLKNLFLKFSKNKKLNVNKNILICHKNTDINEINTRYATEYNKIVPIFPVSSVSGDGIQNVRNFISNLNPLSKFNTGNGILDKVNFIIESVYSIHGIGLVVSGFLESGEIKIGDNLFLGPYYAKFYKITIKSIHNNFRESIQVLNGGNSGCINFKFINSKETLKRNSIRNGVKIVNKPLLVSEFTCRIKLLHHHTTIKTGYQPVIHIGNISQACIIMEMEKETLRLYEDSTVKFKFRYHPEYIETGMKVLFREGKTKGTGEIIEIINYLKN
jgi:GTPase